MILNCCRKQLILFGTVFAALFLFLNQCVFAEELPAGQEDAPTGYLEDSEEKEGFKIGERLFFHFNTDLFYTYSDAKNSDALSGYSIDILAAPTFKISKGTFLSLVYDGGYLKKREFYSDETGYRSRSEFMTHTISPVLKVDFGQDDRYTIKPVLFFTKTYNKDTDSANWGDGLYNYEDLGGGIDYQIRDLFAKNDADDELTLGFQLYQREFPNYKSLLDLAGGPNTETDEKDYLGLILKTDYKQTKDLGLSWSVGYSLFIKWLDDKKVVDSDGVLTSKEQEDYLHMFETKLWYFFEGGLKIGLDLDGHFKNSNQNFYEGFNTLLPNDDIATKDYYDYFMYQISPNIVYQFRLFPLTLFGYFTYKNLEYTDRLAENADESYKTKEQIDETYTSLIGAKYALNENWAVTCQWEHVDAKSNNDNETTYSYDYWSDAYSIGLSVRF